MYEGEEWEKKIDCYTQKTFVFRGGSRVQTCKIKGGGEGDLQKEETNRTQFISAGQSGIFGKGVKNRVTASDEAGISHILGDGDRWASCRTTGWSEEKEDRKETSSVSRAP